MCVRVRSVCGLFVCLACATVTYKFADAPTAGGGAPARADAAVRSFFDPLQLDSTTFLYALVLVTLAESLVYSQQTYNPYCVDIVYSCNGW